MGDAGDFYKAIVDSMADHVAVVDENGNIRYVNRAWVDFGATNDCAIQAGDWLGISYLQICDRSADAGDRFGKGATEGIRKVIGGEQDSFYFEYPCHSQEEQRWFMMKVTPLSWPGPAHYVICHHNITARKLAEERALELSLLDGLTGVANRRHFDEFLRREWCACERLGQPLSLAILDIDHFKPYNDYYGHVVGDECLRRVCGALMPFAEKPGDLLARYGGEEFALILGRTDADAARRTARAMRDAISGLSIPHARSEVAPVVTASIGVATARPGGDSHPGRLVDIADQRLYVAKRQGKNQVSG